MTNSFGTKQKVDAALEALHVGLSPYVGEQMKQRYGASWRQYASRAAGGDSKEELDVYALLKTVLDSYGEVFRQDARIRKARSYISLALDARNAASHFDGLMQDREALRYLDAIRELLDAIGAKPQVAIVDMLYEQQKSGPLLRSKGRRRKIRLASTSRRRPTSCFPGGKSRSRTPTCLRRVSPTPSLPPT